MKTFSLRARAMLTYGEKKVEEKREHNTLIPNLYISIRNLLLNEITRDIDEISSVLKETATVLRQDIPLYKMKRRDAFVDVAGADAGSQIMPLSLNRYVVISALVYSLSSGSRFFLSPELFSIPYSIEEENFKSTVNIRRETKLFETVYDFVNEQPETRLLLIDGPLAFSNWWSIAGRIDDRRKLIDTINRILQICSEEEIIIGGIVKRPSARYFIYHEGLHQETDFSDSFLLLQILKPGERTEIFSPREAQKKYINSSTFMDAIKYPIHSFYGRFSSEWSIPPVRVDIPGFSLSYLEEIADYCYDSSFNCGIPLPIVRADEEVRLSKRFMAEVYYDILTKVGRKIGDVKYLAPYWGEGKWMGV